MRLSLLDQQQQQQRNGNRASSSNSTPNPQPPVLNQRPPTPSQLNHGVPTSSAPSALVHQNERPPNILWCYSGSTCKLGERNCCVCRPASSSPATRPSRILPVAPTHASRVSTSSSSGSSAFASLRGRLTFGKNNDGPRSSEGAGRVEWKGGTGERNPIPHL
jgi:hypothetical protein